MGNTERWDHLRPFPGLVELGEVLKASGSCRLGETVGLRDKTQEVPFSRAKHEGDGNGGGRAPPWDLHPARKQIIWGKGAIPRTCCHPQRVRRQPARRTERRPLPLMGGECKSSTKLEMAATSERGGDGGETVLVFP